MSDRSSTTLGYEWSTNPYLNRELSEQEFVDTVLAEVPARPPYYTRMKELNAAGPRSLGGLPGNVSLPIDEFKALIDNGAVVIDMRDQSAFGGAHIPDSFGIGANGNVSGWASWVVPYDTPIVLVCARDAQREFAIRSLIRVGLDDIRGSLAGGFATWREAGLPVRGFPQFTPHDAQRAIAAGSLSVIDVRNAAEFSAGHISEADNVYLGALEQSARERPLSGQIGVVCRTGYRSTVAASVLERLGYRDLVNLTGGMRAWKNADLAYDKE